MKLQIMDSDALEYLSSDRFIKQNLNKFENYDSNQWLYDAYPQLFVDTKYDNLPELSMDMSAPLGHEFETEITNVIILHSALSPILTDSNASDQRVWAALCLGPLYSYTQYRWRGSLSTVSGVKQHFFLEKDNRRSLTRNAASRLFWIGKLTYDDSRTDHYELTKVVCRYSDFIMHFLERNTSNSLHIMRPFLEAILEAEKEGIMVDSNDGGELSKYLNILGGTYLLDAMPEEWIKDKISNKIEKIVARSLVENTGEVDKSKVKSNSIVTLTADVSGEVKRIKAGRNKFLMNPHSLVGLKIGDSVKIGRTLYHISRIQ